MLLRAMIGLVLFAGLALPTLSGHPPAYVQAQTPTDDILATPPPYESATPDVTGTTTTTSTSAPTSTVVPTATATATLPPNERPDACEPNDDLSQPCQLPTETLVQDLTFVDDQIDVFSFLLKASRMYTISVTASDGIDPAVRLYYAETLDTAIVTKDDDAAGQPGATISTTTGDADGWYVLAVENRGPAGRAGTYTVQAISRAAAPPIARSVEDTQGDADPLENNYDPFHAAQIAWAVPYDLSLRCPETRPDACPAGDHDFLLVPTKAGIPIVAVTYDLGQATDTLLTAYAPDAAQSVEGNGQLAGWHPIASNDDFVAGWTLRSQLLIRPNWTGWLLVVVAPSSRTDPPAIPQQEGPPGRYRLIIGPPALERVRRVLDAQTDVPPTPTTAPTRERGSDGGGNSGGGGGNGGGSSAATPRPQPTNLSPVGDATPATNGTPGPDGGNAESGGNGRDAEVPIHEKCSTGLASVKNDGAGFWPAAFPKAYRAPIATYDTGAQVKLLGQCHLGWVKVQPRDAVTPGWMEARDLAPLDTEAPPPNADAAPDSDVPQAGDALASPSADLPADPDAIGDGQPPTPGAPTAPTPASGSRRPLTVVPQGLAPTPTIPDPVPESRIILVEVCAQTQAGGQRCERPLADVPVVLLHAATRDVLHSGRTGTDGIVRLAASEPAGTGLVLLLPTYGVERALAMTDTSVPIRVPGGAR